MNVYYKSCMYSGQHCLCLFTLPFALNAKEKTLQGHLRLYSYLGCFDKKKKPNDVRRTFIIVYGERPPLKQGTDFLSDA